MASTLGWIDLSAAALQRLRQDLEEKPDGVVDEMGVLALHSGYADRFFPGTSVLQRRPRYVFFTCWNYLCLHRLSGPSAKARKEEAEKWVKQRLVATKQEGIIGVRVEYPAQPADFIYWTALGKWGFYRGPNRNALLNKWASTNVRRVKTQEIFDEDAREDTGASFLVPEPPHYWLQPRPRTEVTFNLTRAEAEFLLMRLESVEGGCLLSSAASQARKLKPKGQALWNDHLISEAAKERKESELVERARQASSLGYLIRATYAALVERRRNETADKSQLSEVEDDSHYRNFLKGLLIGNEKHFQATRDLDPDLLSNDLQDLPPQLLSIVRHVKKRAERVARASDIDRQLLDDDTLEIFSKEEERRKQERARLPDTDFGAERRAEFNEDTLNVFPIDYRWTVVRQMLHDLHDGLRLPQ